MSTARTPKPPVRFALPENVPGLVRAASLALAIARHCKATSWAEFADRVAAEDEATLTLLAGIEVDQADAALVREHDHILRLLHVKPTVSVAVCPVCEAWVLVAGTPPTKCRVTARCTGGTGGVGKPVKASIATKEKVEAAPPADLPEPPSETPPGPEPVREEELALGAV